MRLLVLCLVPLLLPWRTVQGQDTSAVVVGRITSTAGVPVSGVQVTVSRFATKARSDSGGHFRLSGLPPERRLAMTMRRSGFHSLTIALTLRRGETRELILQLAPLPVPLDTMVTEAQAASENLRRAGFYNRQRLGFGEFLTRDDIARMHAVDLWDVLGRVPFLQVRRTPLLQVLAQVPGGTCRPSIYLDGMHSGDIEGIPVDVIDGIELYRHRAQIPLEFSAQGTACATLLLWTR